MALAQSESQGPLAVWLFHHEKAFALGATLAHPGLALWGISQCPACFCAGGSLSNYGTGPCRPSVWSFVSFSRPTEQTTKDFESIRLATLWALKPIKVRAVLQELQTKQSMADLLHASMDQSYRVLTTCSVDHREDEEQAVKKAWIHSSTAHCFDF